MSKEFLKKVEGIRRELTEQANEIASLRRQADFSISLTSIKKLSKVIEHLDDARCILYDIE